jgi:hypothetical protein
MEEFEDFVTASILLGIMLVGVSAVIYLIRWMWKFSLSWELQLGVVGVFLVMIGTAIARLLSR